MYIFNCNIAAVYYPTNSFDLKYATDPAAVTLVDGTKLEVADISKFTSVTNDTPLPGAPRNAAYLGETYTCGNALVPANLGDQSGVVDSLSAGAITARYIFLDDMVGVTTFGGRIGLSEIRFYAYQAPVAENSFTNWIGGYTLPGDQLGFGQDPDKDGLANGLENYFGTHPGEFSTGLTAGAVTRVGGNSFTFTHPHNPNEGRGDHPGQPLLPCQRRRAG